MPRLSLPLLCFGIILVQLDEGRFITKARPKKYDCSVEKYSRENALQTSGKSEEGAVSVSEGTDFGQKKNLNQWVYWFMV